MLLNLENIIEKYELKINGVLHVGGHHGEEVELYNRLEIENVIFFEPDPSCVRVLLTELEKYKEKNYIVQPNALGSKRDVGWLNLASNNGASNSLLNPKKHLQQYPHISFNDRIQINIMALNDVVDSDALRRYNFMNLDVQGFELEVLKGSTSHLPYVDGIICEVNRDEVYEGCPLVEEIDEFLKEYRFERVETSWDGVTWGDAYYNKVNERRINSFMNNVIELPFHGDERIKNMFTNIIAGKDFDIIIETGTFMGHTTKFLGSFNIPVVSIEVLEENYLKSKELLNECNNITLMNCSSIDGLNKLSESLKNKKVFAFLDAHWQNDNALINELNFFSENNIIPTLAIHDFQVPSHPELGFDTWNGIPYNFSNYKQYFDKIYGVDNYHHWYNDGSTNNIKRGIIFVESK